MNLYPYIMQQLQPQLKKKTQFKIVFIIFLTLHSQKDSNWTIQNPLVTTKSFDIISISAFLLSIVFY